MKFVVEPCALKSGSTSVPGDKSISHRALMLGAVATGESRIRGFLAGEDCLATLSALRQMGVHIARPAPTEVTVSGVGSHGLSAPTAPLDMGNSGTAMRLFAGLLAGQTFASQLIGDASLSRRPMQRVIKPLEMMGARIDSSDGMPPLGIQGSALRAIFYTSPVASAQVKSAILLAGLSAQGDVVVAEPAVTRDHTERMLRAMGVVVDSGELQVSMPGGQALQATEIEVPADLSSAAFIILAAILSKRAEVMIPGVGVNPTRTGVIEILQAMGANITLDNIRLYGEEPVADLTACASRLRGIVVDPAKVSLAIDEFPLLFVAAACATGATTFSGLAELRVKESDRIATMAAGLRALGIVVDESPEGAIVQGGKLGGGAVDSHGDHRVAMSFAVAATVAESAITIADTAAVNTSFPGFVGTLQGLGVNICEQNDAGDAESGISGSATAGALHVGDAGQKDNKKVRIIAIDGPSGSGKGTIARNIATALGLNLLDSGALYRLVGLAADVADKSTGSEAEMAAIASSLAVRFGATETGEEQIWLAGEEVSRQIRTEECGRLASIVAAMPAVRAALLELQKGFCKPPGLVADGRDMGTTVFPHADLKIFLTASAAKRADRRHKQLKDKGIDVSLAALSRDIEERDRRDAERAVAPLQQAADARLLDSSNLTIDEVTQTILDWVSELELRE